MKFGKLVDDFGDRPFFELRDVLSLANDRPKSLKNQLSKWVKIGKVTRLRREKYLLNEPYRKREPSVYFLSNQLLRPSYVSLETALQYHGLKRISQDLDFHTEKPNTDWFLASRLESLEKEITYQSYEGEPITDETWKQLTARRIQNLEWDDVRPDVEPFLLRLSDLKAFWKELLLKELREE